MDTHHAKGKKNYPKDPGLMIKLEGLIKRYPGHLGRRDQFKVIYAKRRDENLLYLQYIQSVT